MLFKRLSNFLSSVLFPCFCVTCSSEGSWWCEKCQKEFPFLVEQSTLNKAVGSLAGLTALFNYEEDGPPAKLIKALKYQGALDTAGLWEKLFYTYFVFQPPEWLRPSEEVVLVPVPLHPGRERERGFNQSLVLAGQAAASLRRLGYSVRIEPKILIRIKNTPHQARLDKQGREHNLDGAFKAAQASGSKNIILVDDVYTTGSTLGECARVLLAAGCEKVWGLVGARG